MDLHQSNKLPLDSSRVQFQLSAVPLLSVFISGSFFARTFSTSPLVFLLFALAMTVTSLLLSALSKVVQSKLMTCNCEMAGLI